ncbi:lysine-specific demethylase JMJ30 isoform X3 [Rhododendron vialii]|uniref:lysine-specific demethylase JMJ30 isoform X3 n=1 Tax=Rhododendron vialii TaxID=182163 RepID=UPI00265F6EBB|nr:lysine-specific demethylase JMJ30 isoform X3 [Rhododendron vialii]
MSTASSAAPAPGTLSTPLLDAQGPNILHEISEQGGYAYVGMSTLAAAGDLRAAEAAREVAWEQLHSGPWHSVLPIWRDAYSMACLRVAGFSYAAGEFSEAIRVLDMGLIMGGLALRKDLESAIDKATAKATAVTVSDQGAEAKCRVVPREFNDAEVLPALPMNSLSSNIVSKRSALSMEEFLCDYFLSGCPVVISECMAHWPARTKWNDMDYLKRIAGYRTVPVEVGRNYLCSEWKQELITFSQFLERIQSNDCSPAGPTYLAQHPLFDQIEELRKDILIPDYCFTGGGELKSLNAWFGPAGTVTPLHHDPHHNILAQVVGRKYVRLYRATLSEELYPYNESMLKNSSQVQSKHKAIWMSSSITILSMDFSTFSHSTLDFFLHRVDLDSMDVNKFPKVHDLEFMDCILEEAGEGQYGRLKHKFFLDHWIHQQF